MLFWPKCLLSPLGAFWRIEDYKRQFQKGNKMTVHCFKPFSILYSFISCSLTIQYSMYEYDSLMQKSIVELWLPVLMTRTSLSFDCQRLDGIQGLLQLLSHLTALFHLPGNQMLFQPHWNVPSVFRGIFLGSGVSNSLSHHFIFICKAVLWSLQKYSSSLHSLRFSSHSWTSQPRAVGLGLVSSLPGRCKQGLAKSQWTQSTKSHRFL